MAVSQLEVNFTRLLARCEGMAAEKKFSDWRLDKYLDALDDWLVQLSNIPLPPDAGDGNTGANGVIRPPPDVITAYKKKVEFLRNLSATEKLTKAGDKALATGQLLGGGQTGPTQATVADKSVGKTSELQLAAQGRLDQDLREELFGDANRPESKKEDHEKANENTKAKESQNEKRGGMTTEDMDQVMQHHKNAQVRVGCHSRRFFPAWHFLLYRPRPFCLKCMIDVSYGVALIFWARCGRGGNGRGGLREVAMGWQNF